jgi:hypothetical protein
VHTEFDGPIDGSLGDASEVLSEIADNYDIHLDGSFRETYTCDSGMQGRTVDELLDAAVQRPVLDQLQVEVGRSLEDRA